MAQQSKWSYAFSLLKLRDFTRLETPHSLGFLRTGDRPVAVTATYTTHNIHNRQTSMFQVGFEPATPASERPQSLTLDRTATGVRPKTKHNPKNTPHYNYCQPVPVAARSKPLVCGRSLVGITVSNPA